MLTLDGIEVAKRLRYADCELTRLCDGDVILQCIRQGIGMVGADNAEVEKLFSQWRTTRASENEPWLPSLWYKISILDDDSPVEYLEHKLEEQPDVVLSHVQVAQWTLKFDM